MNTMKKTALLTALFFLLTGTGFAADQTIASTEEMVGSGHATKTDTLNRHGLVGHETDGTHKPAIATTGGTLTVDETATLSSKAPKASPVFTGDVTLSGKAVNTTLPAFSAIAAQQANVTGNGTVYTITFTSEIFDQAANFDGTSTFTAPGTGKYFLSTTINTAGLTANHTYYEFYLVTSNRSYAQVEHFAAQGENKTFIITTLADMDAADTAYVTIAIWYTDKTVDLLVLSFFSGHLAF